jgi:HAD superfamily hydrolase (TIGR01450 family)
MGIFSRSAEGKTPLDGVDVVLADLDGVVYAGAGAIAYAVESLNTAAQSHQVGYITNNASRTATSVSEHLNQLGLTTTTEDIVTSPQAAMPLLAKSVPPGSTILVIGGDGLISECEKNGYRVTFSAEDNPAAVVQGFSPDLGWKNLAEAAFALNARPSADAFGGTLDGEGEGIPWIATNMDWTIPVERGVAPGNGTLVSAVHTAVGRLPVVAGKPELPIFQEAARRFSTAEHPEQALFIGDRLDTDISGGNKAGMKTALVLTGIDQAKQLLAAPEGSRPTYILGDLRELSKPYPEIKYHTDGSIEVRGARVRKDGMNLVIVSRGKNHLDLLRAACQVIWDSGLAIFGFRVPAELYS